MYIIDYLCVILYLIPMALPYQTISLTSSTQFKRQFGDNSLLLKWCICQQENNSICHNCFQILFALFNGKVSLSQYSSGPQSKEINGKQSNQILLLFKLILLMHCVKAYKSKFVSFQFVIQSQTGPNCDEQSIM